MTATSSNLLRHVRQLTATRACEQWTDRQLLERFAAERDEAMFGLLVRRHGPMVLGLCRRLLGHEQDAEDAFQAAFLLLARKADSIRQTNVGGWLYRVTYHVAIRARAQAVKRKQRQQRGEAVSSADPLMEVAWKELRQVVDEELQRLPEATRSALVLCYLEGKTQEEAARLLGWSKGTLRRRLDQGRELLRTRLLRRGLAPMAALTASLIVESTASAAVSAALAGATVRAIVSKTASSEIMALVQSGYAVVSVSKAKAGAAILLLASLLGGAGLYCFANPQRPQEQPLPKLPAGEQTAGVPRSVKRETVKTVAIHGRVLGPDGKPKSGAKLLLLGAGDKPRQLATTAADGRFTVSVPKETKDKYLIAQADGFGIDFLALPISDPKKPIAFRLVKDQPIRGRIINTEGKPVRGVRVGVANLGVFANNSLDSFLAIWKSEQRVNSGLPNGEKHIWEGAETLLAATTDAEGRFTLSQAGAERLVSLRLSEGGIADAEMLVVNRSGFDPKPYNEAVLNNSSSFDRRFYKSNRWQLRGPDLSVIAEAGKTIRGVVKDADSGKAMPGVLVKLTRDGSDLLWVRPRTRTDAQGNYEIRGARKSGKYMLELDSDTDNGYMACQVWAADTPGYKPVHVDIGVKKGVIFTGRVIDKATGKAIPGFAMAAALTGNPFVKDYPEFTRSANYRTWETDALGVFRVVALPGPVILMGGPDERRLPGGGLEAMRYKPPVADAKYPQFFRHFADHTAYLGVRGFSPLQGNYCKVLEIKAGTTLVHHDIVLERASSIAVKIQDTEGRPLGGVWATGIGAWDGERAIQLREDSCPAYAVEPGKPRLMVFYDRTKKLTGTVTIKGHEKAPIVVKLGQSGALKGKLLAAAGKPLVGAVIEVRYRARQAEEIDAVIRKAKQIVTDAQGEFILDELIPGLTFELSFRHGRRRMERETKPAQVIIPLQAGECRDVGAIKLK